ncbi:MAG: ssDNA-binding protein [Candidatus Methylomirabilis sp.]
MADKKQVKKFVTPEGRLVWGHLFEKEAGTFNGKPAVPAYKVQMAFELDALKDLIDEVYTLAQATWGNVELDIDGGTVATPFKDGDEEKAKKESRGKKGDAFAGKIVFSAKTIYNSEGQDAPGGIEAYLPDLSKADLATRGEFYNGCMGQAAITMGIYTDNNGKPGINFYLAAFQQTGDSERLFAQTDHSSLFTARGGAVGRTAAAPAGRRVRKG